jgi:hypothetical protein
MTQQPMHPIRDTNEGLSQGILLSCLDIWDRKVAVPTTFGYRADDPYAVALVFHSASGDVEWVVSRTLLLQGLVVPCGDGDVKVAPGVDDSGRAVAVIEFCSPDGRLTAHADAAVLQSFLARTFDLVPVGAESRHIDMDLLVASLLDAG